MSDATSDPTAAERIIDLIARGYHKAQDTVRPARREAFDAHLTDWLDRHEDELAGHLAPYLRSVIDNPDVPDHTRAMFAQMAAPEHATTLSLLVLGVGAVVLPLVQALVAPHAQSIANAAWAGDSQAPLSVSEVALGSIKHTLGGIDKYVEASQTGYNARRFDVIEGNTGEPPAIGQLQEALNRQVIDRGRFDHGLHQSRVRDEWEDVLYALRQAPPPIGQIIAGVVQNQMTNDYGAQLFVEAGGRPEDYDWMVGTHGRPPGIEQMLHLLNRGIVSEADVVQAIRESDVKNKYVDQILAMRVYLPPVRSIVPMLRSGAIDDARARQLLTQQGVTPADADVYIKEAHSGRVTAQRDLTVSQIQTLYIDGHLSRAQAAARITAMHFDASEADELLTIADDRRRAQLVAPVLTKLRTLYVGHHLDAGQVTTDLGALGIDAAHINQLVAVWTAERKANVAHLTVAQLQGGLRRGLLDLPTFMARVTGLGYSGVDAQVLAAEAYPPTRAPTAKQLTASQVTAALKAQVITQAQALAQLEAAGYSATQAQQIVTTALS